MSDQYLEAYDGASWEVKRIAAGQGVRRRRDMSHDERRAHDRQNERRRKAVARARAKAKERQDVEDAKPISDPRRMTASLVIMGHLREILARIVVARYNKVRRTLGDVNADDIASDALIASAEGIARQEHYPLVDLLAAAKWLEWQPGIPEVVDKEAPTGAKWLMGVMVRQVRNQIVNTYRTSVTSTTVVDEDGQERRVDNTIESLEYLETALANMGGVDAMIAHFHADRTPEFGWRDPGSRDRRRFARIAVESAIEARDLGWLADVMLNDDNVYTNGGAKWADIAEPVWRILRDECALPELNTDVPSLRVELIKHVVRRVFDFLPDAIIDAHTLSSDPRNLADYTRSWLNEATIEVAEGSGEPYKGSDARPMVGSGRLEEILTDQEKNARVVLADSGIRVQPFHRDYETVRAAALRALGTVRRSVSETELV